MFWEASIFANSVMSFTTNGFFEKEGYVEPKHQSASSLAEAILIHTLVGFLAILAGAAYQKKRISQV